MVGTMRRCRAALSSARARSRYYATDASQVRASLFGPVVHGLSECAALRYITPDDPLWQQAAAGLTSIIQAGLPAVNIMFVNFAQQPENAWLVLADTFETFLLGEGLPEGLVPVTEPGKAEVSADQQPQQRQLQHSSSEAGNASFQQRLGPSSSIRASRAAGAVDSPAEAALQKAVLDTLTEQVLTSCSSAGHEQRSRLVRVLVVGAASSIGHVCCCTSSTGRVADAAAPSPSIPAAETGGSSMPAESAQASSRCTPPDQRFSQMCLRRLALLASRGTDGRAGSMNAVLLEVAQLALPQLVERCRTVLQAYTLVEQQAAVQDLQQLQQELHRQRRQQADVDSQQQQQGWSLVGTGIEVDQQQEGASFQAEHAVAEVLANQQQQKEQEQQLPCLQVGLQQQCLVEEVLCVLHVLLDLQLDVAVFEHLLEQAPSVAACLAAAQHAQLVRQQLQQQPSQAGPVVQQLPQQSPRQRQQQAPATEPGRRSSQGLSSGAEHGATSDSSKRHQGHLLLLYNELAQCAGCRDRRVSVLVRAALQAAGRQLSL